MKDREITPEQLKQLEAMMDKVLAHGPVKKADMPRTQKTKKKQSDSSLQKRSKDIG
jgi:hypothetical protein